jgi:uncharacterized membrane protein YsdA (DUF1294 family)
MTQSTGLVAPIALAILAVINGHACHVYRRDKGLAIYNRSHPQHPKNRIPERDLLMLALCLGVVGAWVGMYGFAERHKTRDLAFLMRFWGIVALYVVAGYALLRHGYAAL